LKFPVKVLAVVLAAAAAVAFLALLDSALRAPDPTVPDPIQIREGTGGRETPGEKKRPHKTKRDRSRKRPKPAPPPAQEEEGAEPVAPAPPPAGNGDDDDDDEGDDDDEDDETDD
jgi:type IV secretory pathway VirB10-like protein